MLEHQIPKRNHPNFSENRPCTVVENKHHILQKRRSQSLTCSKNVKPVPQTFTSTKLLKQHQVEKGLEFVVEHAHAKIINDKTIFTTPFRPLPSWSACMVPCEGRSNTPASSSTDHPQSLAGIAVRFNHPSTSQTAMDRIQTEPAPLHTATRSTPIDRNLPTAKPHYSRS